MDYRPHVLKALEKPPSPARHPPQAADLVEITWVQKQDQVGEGELGLLKEWRLQRAQQQKEGWLSELGEYREIPSERDTGQKELFLQTSHYGVKYYTDI